MIWEVEHTKEFDTWWNTLGEAVREDIDAIVYLLEEKGTALSYPYSSGVQGSHHSHMRELRVQSKSDPIRILYAFDPQRKAILLIGGSKRGDNRWYEKNVRIADRLYTEHLMDLRKKRLQ